MFNLFRRKSPVQKLQDKYNKRMKTYYDLSKINRKEAEKYYVEAEAILVEIKTLQNK